MSSLGLVKRQALETPSLPVPSLHCDGTRRLKAAKSNLTCVVVVSCLRFDAFTFRKLHASCLDFLWEETAIYWIL